MFGRILFLLWALASTAFALTEQQVDETFEVRAGPRLIVDVDFGTIDRDQINELRTPTFT